MNDSQPTLSVQNLETHFFTKEGVAKAVNGVSFDIAKGEIMGLVGESGSGKSVTGFSIIGLVDPPGEVVGGKVLFNGEDLVQAGEERMRQLRGNRVAMIFQDPMMTLNPVLRIDTQMIEAVQAHTDVDRATAWERAREVLGLVGIASPEERLKSYPHQFSGGMRQRVGLARALAVNADVLLMDEPLSALDSQTSELLIDDLVDLWTRTPFTACYVTHNLAEAVRLGHKVAVFSRRPGKIRETVDIDIPLQERTANHPDLEKIRQHLWELMREEAQAADQELADA